MKFLRVVCVLLLWCWLVPVGWATPIDPMLPQVDDQQRKIAGWLMSEKLDGVRGYWDGKQLWSKHGVLFHPPPAFLADLPPFPLEGELWGGRGTFETTAGIVRRQAPDPGWLKLRFAIFDAPAVPGSFAARIAVVKAWFAKHPSAHAFVIPQQPVRDRQQLRRELARVETLGGEGLIVRDPAAPYAAGRSPRILKVKSCQDAEAVVVRELPGKGRLTGMMGSLLVEEPDGTRFRIGTGFSDEQRRHPPEPGTVITFRFHGRYSSGIPKFPSFLRVRADEGL